MRPRTCRWPTPFLYPSGGPASDGPARKDDREMTSAAMYARVSSARQKKDETIASQTAALRVHAQRLGLEVPDEWVFEDEGHSGATLVRPALERLRDLVAGVGIDVRVVLFAGSAGPQVRLPGPAAGGVRPRRHPGGVRQGPARRLARGSAAGAVPGHVRRVREGPDHGALPTRQGAPRPHRVDQRALGRPVRLPLRPQERPRWRRLRGRRARGRAGGRAVSSLRRRRGLHRGPGALAHQPERADSHRQASLGPLGDLGHVAQPGLRRDRGVRQDHGGGRIRRA